MKAVDDDLRQARASAGPSAVAVGTLPAASQARAESATATAAAGPPAAASDGSSGDQTAASPWACRVCGSARTSATWRVPELMFRRPESFDYRLCGTCGCLQIAEVPADLSPYYGDGYYSFGSRTSLQGLAAASVRARNRHLAGRFDPVGRVLSWFRPYLALASLRRLKLRRDARIVDVGCGNGELLQALRSAGFSHLLGVDPFIAADIDLGGGLRVRRTALGALQGPFDVVMFHHSLEHIADQHGTLQEARRLLAPGGRCVVRVPTVSSRAWRHYGATWCALDAPRHLVLHSRDSIRQLALACGFAVERIDDDSTAFQFWGSEQYRQGVPLMRSGCHDIVPAPGLFTRAQLRRWARDAAALNRVHDGDQIVVHLRRA